MEYHHHPTSAMEWRIGPLELNSTWKNYVKLCKRERVTVTTPNTLARLFEHQHLLFLRLCHLPSDTFAMIFPKAIDQMLRY